MSTVSEDHEKKLIEFANLFQSDTLFVHDSIKNIMLQHSLDYRDKNLQLAFMKVAIGIKKLTAINNASK